MGDPIHQFVIVKYFTLGHIGPYEIAFTNSALFMLLAFAVIALMMLVPTRGGSLVPSRMQSVAEMSYEFVATTIRSTTGNEGMRFFPFVFSIFMFVMMVNMLGVIPFSYSVTSQLIVTVALALLVFFTVLIYGFYKNGLRFLKLFVPAGIPIYILPLVTAIEVMSFFTRPVSHSVRLFANMLAGHITLQVFAGFIIMLGAFGIPGIVGASLPLALVVALYMLEVLVAALQAYVFAILTCIYLNDALHPGH
jgi:F-type H+-transporting ATPase subunit a